MRIGVDIMGSEKEPQEYFSAISQMAEQLSSPDTLVILATQDILDQIPPQDRVTFHPVKEMITMEDDPLTSIRRKKESSLLVGVDLIKEGKIDALITAGNTGALVAHCTLALPLFPEIKRPALLATLPKELAVIDVGGHISYKAEHLVQYAFLGAAYQRIAKGIDKPTIGLLNIGTETDKGTDELQKAHHILREESPKHRCHFIGNVEGKEVFQNPIDVLVTDGFTGNVFLKTVEGISSYFFDHFDIKRDSIFQTTYPGAILSGIEGIVIKCHGSATSREMVLSMQAAIKFIKGGLIEKMKQELTL